LLAETIGTGRDGAAALGMFAEVMEPKVPRAARVAFRWLRAVALERIGDIVEAERELLAAESMDPDWPLPLFDLARIASDRGDVERGLSLLHRAGADPDDLLVELLEKHRAEPRRDLGRNELCWCGSGRKYKKCHLGREQLPLAERVGWLYAKAVQHALLSGWRELQYEVAYHRCRHADDDDPDALMDALADPLVLDAVLFEGGAFEEFLEMRGSLLPEDERLLAEQWLLVDRSVFEIEQVHGGQGFTVRDVRTGDTHEVRERTASRQVKSGQLLCARLVPAGDTMQFVGVVEPVALQERDALIDVLDTGPDAVALVAQLSRRLAQPTLTNTEGDLLAICEATVQVGDPGGIESALDDAYDRVDGEEPPQWFDHVTTQGMRRIRATLVLDGDTLLVETNSEMRMDRVLATLRRVDPMMKVLNESRRPVRDARDAAELAKQMPINGEEALDPDDPYVATAIEDFIREYETNWLDQPIPALDGHTPRQAADDPTRRGDLIKLLDSFPAGEAARGGMDADRLRAALGLR
jgi:SEC-C motif